MSKNITKIIPDLARGIFRNVIRKHHLRRTGIQPVDVCADLDRYPACAFLFAEHLAVDVVWGESFLGLGCCTDGPEVDWEIAVVVYNCVAVGAAAGGWTGGWRGTWGWRGAYWCYEGTVGDWGAVNEVVVGSDSCWVGEGEGC